MAFVPGIVCIERRDCHQIVLQMTDMLHLSHQVTSSIVKPDSMQPCFDWLMGSTVILNLAIEFDCLSFASKMHAESNFAI